MAGVTRQGDNCSGHADWPPRLPTSWSSDVFVNGLGVVKYGDSWSVHCNLVPICHGGTSTGTGSVYVNGNVLQVQGDSISCGSVCDGCSNNVFAKG